jgi:competence protein ComEC
MLVLGICIQHFTGFMTGDPWYVLIILTILLFISKRIALFPLFTGIFFFILGVYSNCQFDDRNLDNYYKNYLSEDSSAILRVGKVLKSNVFSHRYEAEVVQVDSIQTKGKILLSIRQDSVNSVLEMDDQLWVPSKFMDVKAPLNPHQFDYKAYLARQGIHQQMYLEGNELIMLRSSSTFFGRIASIRNQIQESLSNEGFREDEYGVINALLLGQRQEVSRALLKDYSKARAIHILAISGLHVGIILLILTWVFKPLEILRNGRLLKLILIVIILWFFALLAGMSASVVRAVTMFTAVAIGQSLQRKNSVIHSLIFSMFVLLLCKPMFLFDVGFQLSYLAVFGIVTIQPKLVQLWKPKWKLLDKGWQLTTVSIAAQLSVLPLSLFYFHQFPGLFLVSNLVIVPFLGVILMGGILVIMLSLCSALPEMLVDFYGGIISGMNAFIQWVSEQESFLFSGISFSPWIMLASYLLIIFGFRFFDQRRKNRLVLFMTSVLVFQSVLFLEKFTTASKSEFVLFNQQRASVYGVRNGNQLESNAMENRNIESYVIGENVNLLRSKKSTNFMSFQNQQILFVDSLGVYQLENLQSPIVVLQYSPKINLDRLIEELHPIQIVADASNYRSSIKRWERSCLEAKTPFWNTNQEGAYFLKLEGSR